MKNILLVSHSPFPTNSSVHVHHFANELIKLGLDCVVAIPNQQEEIVPLKDNLYKITQYGEIEAIADFFANSQPPDLVHAWTPRQHVAHYCYSLSIRHEFKLVIHLEDNEECVTERFLDISLADWTPEQEKLLLPNLSHPFKYKELMATADGVSIIIDKLAEFVPADAEQITLYPGVDLQEFYPREQDSSFLESLEIPEGTTIICYTGNVHLANIDEVLCLYLAVGKLNQLGTPTRLIRTGHDFKPEILNQDQLWVKKYIVNLGWLDRSRVPEILALADVLIQPGTADKFNDYRFPSKIPEFLAMGKPVIVPNTNIGKILSHQENALVLDVVDENSLPSIIQTIVKDHQLNHKLADNALKFAEQNLNWAEKGKQLYSFYQSLYAEERAALSVRKALTRSRIYYHELNSLQDDYYFYQEQIAALELEITAMKTSKFWKLRERWFKFKSRFNSNQQ